MVQLETAKVFEMRDVVLGYCDDILDGTINAGVKAKQAIKRFLNDYEKSLSDESYPYYMDWGELYRFERWSNMFRHTKGVLVGQRIKLVPFQLWVAGNVIAFKKKDDDTRRYDEAYIQIGRKNAKSQLIATIASYIAFLSKEIEEIYVSCWSKDQSKLVYQEVINQVRSVKILKNKWKDTYSTFTVHKNGSIIKPLSREAKKTGEGTNPSVAILDEYKDNQTDELYEVQKTGMMARKNPLLMIITTAGQYLSYPCYQTYLAASRILDPELDDEDENMFVAIWEVDKGDDIKDEKNFIKANPILATYEKGLEALRRYLRKAILQPEKMRGFMTKNLNMWVDMAREGFMNMNKWNQSMFESDKPFIEILKELVIDGWKIFIGADLSMTTDLTSLGIVAVKDKKYQVFQHSFIPEERFEERMNTDKVRFDLWKEEGYLTVTPGSTVDYFYILKFIEDIFKVIPVREFIYDKMNATMLASAVTKLGIPAIEMPQNYSHLSLPTKEFRDCVYNGLLTWLKDSLLKWAIGNAVLKTDEYENIQLSKRISRERIDPAAAVIFAFARAMVVDQNLDINERILSEGFGF
ncbi:MAG: terminase large subunit [Streptococcaceae bacterium]|jgi:phage terminase large subunit-like protein|nr:terminase large subunit [Streptococcaceae bacterium]